MRIGFGGECLQGVGWCWRYWKMIVEKYFEIVDRPSQEVGRKWKGE